MSESEVIKFEKLYKILPDFPNYAVTEDGEVLNVKTGKIISQFLCGIPPYYSVNFTINGKSKQQRVHRVVAMAWLVNDDPENKIQVNHKDGNKLNNHVDNLEWCTPSQNQQHAISTELKNSSYKMQNASLTEAQAHSICQLLMDGWTTKDVAVKFEIPRSTVLKIRCGDVYKDIRSLYDIPTNKKYNLSEQTVRWVCEQIINGFSDSAIADMANNKAITTIMVKKIRYKIRFKSISSEYF
jgi:hypothetical protein